MTDPLKVLADAALARLQPLAQQLRSEGWDAGLRLVYVDVGLIEVELIVTLAQPVPVEAAPEDERVHAPA